ncbi:TonB-dependent receptor domain-containing protein [Novosphingobium sp. BL-52-GroH]|uniref:TonB-dependent receptor domain-containing protein n=1 Tax=Novosphingobium sp. BL-52-GroH TaxID=3349877 RepID=UPI00384CCBE5
MFTATGQARRLRSRPWSASPEPRQPDHHPRIRNDRQLRDGGILYPGPRNDRRQLDAGFAKRYETYENFPQNGASRSTDQSSTDSCLPRRHLVYQPRTNVSVYVSYARAFAPNSSVPDQLA